MKKLPHIAITGPTSSGKTKLAIELAKELNGEIISVDSRQIYRQLDIGSAKPSCEEKEGIAHHLIDIADITQDYTVANFCDDAQKVIRDITKRGKTVILAGGTGLYFRTLLRDFDLPRVAPDKQLREELEQKSSSELYKQLLDADYDIAQKIHPNNKVKIIRALEVCIKLEIPMSKAQKKKENRYDVLWYGLNSQNRDVLYEKINERTEMMFDKGLEKEALELFEKYPNNKILTGTIGYKEFLPYISGEISSTEVKEAVKLNTRRYAKRQISWFKSDPDIKFFYTDKESFENIKNAVIQDYVHRSF